MNMYISISFGPTARLIVYTQVKLLEVRLDGSEHGSVNVKPDTGRISANEAGIFLSIHRTAKIVIIIDTHCLENGAFVWVGNDPVSYQACFMPLVSTRLSCAMQNLTGKIAAQ